MKIILLLTVVLCVCGCVSPGAPQAVKDTIKREQTLYTDLKAIEVTVNTHVDKQMAQADKPDEVKKEEAALKATVIPQLEKGKDDIVQNVDKLKEAEIVETKKEEGTSVMKWIAIAAACIAGALIIFGLKSVKIPFLG